MKNKITVELLKARVQEYIAMVKDEPEYSVDWAYAMLEPDLLVCEEVTLNYLMQISEEEFVALGENHWFEDILCKFKSVEFLNVILQQYAKFYGDNKTTVFYQNYIECLHHCIEC